MNGFCTAGRPNPRTGLNPRLPPTRTGQRGCRRGPPAPKSRGTQAGQEAHRQAVLRCHALTCSRMWGASRNRSLMRATIADARSALRRGACHRSKRRHRRPQQLP
eukprot:13421522-Alexandrium_andersonii.AAC.1